VVVVATSARTTDDRENKEFRVYRMVVGAIKKQGRGHRASYDQLLLRTNNSVYGSARSYCVRSPIIGCREKVSGLLNKPQPVDILPRTTKSNVTPKKRPFNCHQNSYVKPEYLVKQICPLFRMTADGKDAGRDEFEMNRHYFLTVSIIMLWCEPPLEKTVSEAMRYDTGTIGAK
jgi:hypothetical protein